MDVMNTLRVENIPAKDFHDFRVRCVSANMTMREALIYCIAQIAKGKLLLPERKLP
jgi:hypothetical protein